MYWYVCSIAVVGGNALEPFAASHIEARLGAVGQHERDGAIVDPDQLGQTHRIQTRHIRYGRRGVAFDAARL